jgi:hypothetical protein
VSVRTPQCTEPEIDRILNSCEKNNEGIGITGVLLYSATNFIQYIEGDYKTIISLYDRIKTDPRHKNVVLIASAPIQDRSFPSWHMGARKIDMSGVEFKTEISAEDQVIFQTILSGKALAANKAFGLIKKFFK